MHTKSLSFSFRMAGNNPQNQQNHENKGFAAKLRGILTKKKSEPGATMNGKVAPKTDSNAAAGVRKFNKNYCELELIT